MTSRVTGFIIGILILLLLATPFTLAIIAVRVSKNHCIPRNGVLNNAENIAINLIGIEGVRCQE